MKLKMLMFTLVASTQLFAGCFDSCGGCDPCSGWNITGDWIYWKTRRCDLDFLLPAESVSYNYETQFYSAGKIIALDLDYDSGFRVGVSKCCEDFDFGANYTYYHTSSSKTKKSTNDFLSTRTRPNDDLALKLIDYGKAKYDLDYDVFDIEAGYTWDCDCNLVRLFGGVELAFIDQTMDTRYAEDSSNLSGYANSPEASTVKETVDMDAYGLYIGGEGHWTICNCFGIFGNSSIGALVADFDRKFVNKDVNDIVFSPSDKNLTNVKDNCEKIITHFSIAAGVEYTFTNCFCGDWLFQVGYEFHNWSNMLDFIQFMDDSAEGNLAHHESSLGFDGLFVRLGFSF